MIIVIISNTWIIFFRFRIGVIALDRKCQDRGYDTVGRLSRDCARSRVFVSLPKGIPFGIEHETIVALLVTELIEDAYHGKHVELFPAADPQGITGSYSLYLLPHSLRGARCCTSG